MKKIKGGITAAEGYQVAGISCGIKKSGKKDLALIYSEYPALGAAVFTKNKFKAAPLIISEERIKNDTIRAILINSGNANACTGQQGLDDVKKLTSIIAKKLEIDSNEIHMSSTGIIGELLPTNKIEKGIEKIIPLLNKDANLDASEAILTTDTVKKEIAFSFKLPSSSKEVKIGGMAKGSGMIHPNMATMLGFITTDLNISKELLSKALREVVNCSFNRISVDGDQSTNDSVFLMANARADNEKIVKEDEDYQIFVEILKEVSVYLAKAIVADGEGATRFITINVSGARTELEAEEIARNIANSNLVKTACFGGDPNWGRIIAVLGTSEFDFDIKKVSLSINDKCLFENGTPIAQKKEDMGDLMTSKEIEINLDLAMGNEKVEFWSTDLTYDYVKINAEYHT
ncbi:bifunctional glutamate N-acetyltransferase/amino-acid acetyltransferase ArgJ [Natronospora cellulosivora (SeqCode)]